MSREEEKKAALRRYTECLEQAFASGTVEDQRQAAQAHQQALDAGVADRCICNRRAAVVRELTFA